MSERVTREELAEALRGMETALKQKSRRCSDCIHHPPDNNYVVEFCQTCTFGHQDNWKSKFVSRLDAERGQPPPPPTPPPCRRIKEGSEYPEKE